MSGFCRTTTPVLVGAVLLQVQCLWAQATPRPLIDPDLARFHIADGRLCCIVKTHEDQRKTRSGPTFPRQELTIDAGSHPWVRLVAECASGERCVIDFQSGEVTIRWSTNQAVLDLHQDRQGELRMVRDGVTTVFPSFWHLLLAENDRFGRDHLIPVLQLLRPQWGLEKQLSHLKQRLLNCNEKSLCQSLVQRWVDALASRDFVARRNADRALRSYGQEIVPLLRQLDLSRLNAEQRRRIQQIGRACVTDREDDVERVVSRLLGDLWVWCYFLNADQESVRKTAHRRLCSILDQEISFNTQADLQGRMIQINRIQRDLRIPSWTVATVRE
jgi:hypothetical protein